MNKEDLKPGHFYAMYRDGEYEHLYLAYEEYERDGMYRKETSVELLIISNVISDDTEDLMEATSAKVSDLDSFNWHCLAEVGHAMPMLVGIQNRIIDCLNSGGKIK